MKKILLYTLAAGIISMVACTDILETAPHDQLSSGTMWTTEELVDQGVSGVYFSLRKPVRGNGLVSEDVNIGHYGFEAYGMTGQTQTPLYDLYTSSVTPSNETFSYVWKWCYDGIHRANDAIANIPGSPVKDAKKKNRLIAECKVLRAFFYMRLNELFGREGLGVPLYTEPVEPVDCTKGQSPESEVWAQVIQDLTEAINEPELLNNYINGEGRVSKGAAYAFRGRVYLMTKQYDNAIADFAKVGECGYSLYPDYKLLFKTAQERCREMIFSVQNIEDPASYGSYLQKFFALFQQGAKDSRGCWNNQQAAPRAVELYEVIVDANTVKPFNWSDFFPEWESISTSGTPNRKVFFIRDKTVGGMEVHSTVTTVINNELNNLNATARALYLPEGNEARIKTAYENRDPRLQYNVVTPYSDILGVNSISSAEAWYTYRFPVTGKYYSDQAGAEPNMNTNLPKTYYTSGTSNNQAQYKYIYRKFTGDGLEYARRTDNPIDEPIIRYADVLLMWAEALVEKKDFNGAMDKVKQVRDRAGVATMSTYFADETTARNYVRDERRRELLGEGVNFFDEMRWKTLKETKFEEKTAKHVWGGTESIGNTTYYWLDKDQWYTWPIPKAETELNTNLQRTPNWVY